MLCDISGAVRGRAAPLALMRCAIRLIMEDRLSSFVQGEVLEGRQDEGVGDPYVGEVRDPQDAGEGTDNFGSTDKGDEVHEIG